MKTNKGRLFRTIALIILVGLLLRIVIPRLLLLKYWVGDYRIEINTDYKTVNLLEYRGDENMVLPSTIGPFTVVYVNRDIFTSRDDITSIYIPADIDPDVLIRIKDCVNLRKIEFEEGIKVISLHAYDCNNLEEVIIPEGVEVGGNFTRCSSLGEIKLPSTFKEASEIDYFDTKFSQLHEKDKYYVVGDGVLLFTNIDIEKDIVIPQGVRYFKDFLRLYENTLRKIYIPESMNSLILEVDEGDTIYFGGEAFEVLDLDMSCDGVKSTIVAPANSYVESFCKENGYNFRVMTDEEENEWREKTEAAASEITYQEN